MNNQPKPNETEFMATFRAAVELAKSHGDSAPVTVDQQTARLMLMDNEQLYSFYSRQFDELEKLRPIVRLASSIVNLIRDPESLQEIKAAFASNDPAVALRNLGGSDDAEKLVRLVTELGQPSRVSGKWS